MPCDGAHIPSDLIGHLAGPAVTALRQSEACHRDVIFNVDRFPDAVPVPAFGPRMVCTCCGMMGPMLARSGPQHRPSRAWR